MDNPRFDSVGKELSVDAVWLITALTVPSPVLVAA